MKRGEMLPHPPYSPTLVPSGFFVKLKDSLQGIQCRSVSRLMN